MGPEIYKVANIGRGVLAVMAKPVAGEWIGDEFSGIARYGITEMVSLLERHEIRELGLTGAPALCASNGIAFTSFPIADRGLPAAPGVFALVHEIGRRIADGAHTVIHCRAGIGRTGLLAAAVLVRHGHAPEAAFKLVSRARGVQVPDTAEQFDWVVQHQQRLQSTE
ncbi:protein tyrosine phosphatase [Massilia sp. CCM 8733]|uniref:Protein tyrosine phosphatase n=1 Tax=Massilia mucilaginosa TaxID=2609282 RepID=A0ABX0NZ41_9BURK|nr:dual specificity protein phosphatase family protein [Massilia mucilaginosa]NHZ91984.1 protein tyrosine phosphatase [Massilia mucilaginosa]